MEEDEHRAVEQHIARLEEELLRLKDTKRELESLRAEHQRLRRSANGRVAEFLTLPFRWSRRERRKVVPEETAYECWFSRHRLPAERIPELTESSKKWEDRPLVSVLMATYNSDRRWLDAAVTSVCAQIYPQWELLIADDGSTQAGFGEKLTKLSEKDARIRLLPPGAHGGISSALNRALQAAGGEWVALLDHDDLLERDAIFRVVELLQNEPRADVIYSDEDKIVHDHFSAPMLKPDWSPDFFLTHDYLGHFVALRRGLVDEFRSEFDGAQDFDLLLRVSERTQRIHHLERVLYHWRRTPQSTAHNIRRKPGALEAGKQAVAEHLARKNQTARVSVDWNTHAYRVRRPIPEVKISIVATPALSPSAMEAIQSATDFASLEFAVAAESAIGDWVLFLDAGLLPLERSWLHALGEYLAEQEIGAVGPRLLNPDGSVESAGYVLMPDGSARPAFAGFNRTDPGVNRQLQTARNYSALSASCLLTRRDLYQKFGSPGLVGRDRVCAGAEYCLKLRDAGFRSVSVPYAELRREEPGEEATGVCPGLARRWPTIFQNDPCYNSNLSRAVADFSLGAMA
ncbi:MAG: glycosyltransferase [Verrucomicrobiota bacterium]